MKFILLAAAAVIALPAISVAQMAPSQTASTPPATTAPADGTMQPGQPAPTDQSGMAPTASAPADAGQPAPQQPMTTGTPAGGYQPNGSAMQGTMSPGVQPTYQPAPSPAQAFPAPAPKDSYPVCKKGQYDGCTEAAGSGGHKTRRHK